MDIFRLAPARGLGKNIYESQFPRAWGRRFLKEDLKWCEAPPFDPSGGAKRNP